jgi:hypothetical protein
MNFLLEEALELAVCAAETKSLSPQRIGGKNPDVQSSAAVILADSSLPDCKTFRRKIQRKRPGFGNPSVTGGPK